MALTSFLMNLFNLKPPNPEQFAAKELGNKILFHRKEASVKWDDSNKYFRSSMWDKESGELISAGFRAFVNLGEQPDFEPWSESLQAKAMLKLDGSLLIVSKHKGELIIRTRGTFNAADLPNGSEIELLKEAYPHAFDNMALDGEDFTLLFEWVTPSNIIVLREYIEPTLILIGMVRHKDYSYVDQDSLDKFAKHFKVLRPTLYEQTNSADLVELLKDNKSIEGVVLYSECGQILKKIKTPHYLHLHKLLAGFKSFRNVVDLWKEYGYPSVEDFSEKIASFFDWEVLESVRSHLEELRQKIAFVEQKIESLKTYAKSIEHLSRKEQAQMVLNDHKEWSFLVFNILSNKNLPPLEKLFDVSSSS